LSNYLIRLWKAGFPMASHSKIKNKSEGRRKCQHNGEKILFRLRLGSNPFLWMGQEDFKIIACCFWKHPSRGRVGRYN
jgi:hypothetical protein